MKKKYPLKVKIVAGFFIFFFLFVIVEGVSTLALRYKEGIKKLWGLKPLNPYEIEDPHHPGNWILKPGFSQTLREIIEEKERTGKFLAVKHLKETARLLNIREDEIIIQINSKGFRGPEIDPYHSKTRILTLGDSCTFGTIERFTYPRVLERELNEYGFDVEVINGGVEGYSPHNILLNIDIYKALEPEITTVYIGWNAIYTFDLRERKTLASLELLKKAYRRLLHLISGEKRIALMQYKKPKKWKRDEKPLKNIMNHISHVIADVQKILEEMRSSGSEVVIITLPGLFSSREEPSEDALRKGHLPPYTNNPFILARIGEEYNHSLRELAKRLNLEFIDLEEWCNQNLHPKEKFFIDSVHLTEIGQELIGKYIAEKLRGKIEKIGKRKPKN